MASFPLSWHHYSIFVCIIAILSWMCKGNTKGSAIQYVKLLKISLALSEYASYNGGSIHSTKNGVTHNGKYQN